MQDFLCGACDNLFEYLKETDEDLPSCPQCKNNGVTAMLGGHLFSKIVPVYPGSQRLKAGYAHKHVNKPAEKTSVSVPKKIK